MEYVYTARARRKTIIYAVAVFLFLSVLSAVIIWNGKKLLQAVEDGTLNYLRDVAGESVQLVNDRIEGVLESLELISDSMERLEPEARWDFLLRKTEICNFTDLAVADETGKAQSLNNGTWEMGDLPIFAHALEGENGVGQKQRDQQHRDGKGTRDVAIHFRRQDILGNKRS